MRPGASECSLGGREQLQRQKGVRWRWPTLPQRPQKPWARGRGKRARALSSGAGDPTLVRSIWVPDAPILHLLLYRPPGSPTALGDFRPVCEGLPLKRTTPLGLGDKPTCQARRKTPAHLGMVGVQTSSHTQNPYNSLRRRGEDLVVTHLGFQAAHPHALHSHLPLETTVGTLGRSESLFKPSIY